jgi:predicted ABC-type ATPase
LSGARPPRVVVLAGPNGAGKSSAAKELLPDLEIDVFVNADVIAAGLSPANPQGAAISAGRIMLRELQGLIASGSDFAFETTLSGLSYQRLFVDLAAASYEISLYYIWLPGPEMSLERVRRRVELGGHDIPPSDILRRYARGVENFYRIYRPLASRWFVLNGREFGGDREVARGRGLTVDEVRDEVTWQTIQQQAGGTDMNPTPKRVRESAVSRDGLRESIAKADREVLLRHRAAGVPLVLWRDGKVVHVDPNTVELPEVSELAPQA